MPHATSTTSPTFQLAVTGPLFKTWAIGQVKPRTRCSEGEWPGITRYGAPTARITMTTTISNYRHHHYSPLARPPLQPTTNLQPPPTHGRDGDPPSRATYLAAEITLLGNAVGEVLCFSRTGVLRERATGHPTGIFHRSSTWCTPPTHCAHMPLQGVRCERHGTARRLQHIWRRSTEKESKNQR